MTRELAEMLDTKVAERFGRPTWDGWSLRISHNDGQWEAYPHCGTPYELEDNATVAALWLAHLLKVCTDKWWAVRLPPSGCGAIVCTGDEYLGSGDSQLAALAQAMLAVPEGGRSTLPPVDG